MTIHMPDRAQQQYQQAVTQVWWTDIEFTHPFIELHGGTEASLCDTDTRSVCMTGRLVRSRWQRKRPRQRWMRRAPRTRRRATSPHCSSSASPTWSRWIPCTSTRCPGGFTWGNLCDFGAPRLWPGTCQKVLSHVSGKLRPLCMWCHLLVMLASDEVWLNMDKPNLAHFLQQASASSRHSGYCRDTGSPCLSHVAVHHEHEHCFTLCHPFGPHLLCMCPNHYLVDRSVTVVKWRLVSLCAEVCLFARAGSRTCSRRR